MAQIPEHHDPPVSDGGREGGEDFRIHRGAHSGHPGYGGAQPGELRTQSAGENLFQLREGAHGRFSEARYGAGCDGAQADGDGECLLIIEEQRRQLGSGPQLIAAGDSGGGMDGVAEGAEFADIPADGALSDGHPCGEGSSRPLAPKLQQGEQLEQPC